MGGDEIEINYEAITDITGNVLRFLKQKKVIYSIVMILLLLILFTGSWIRLQNLPILKDSTTERYIPLALDPFYFLRVATTITKDGTLPEFDSMRYIPAKIKFGDQLLPQVIVLMYRVGNLFGNYSIDFIDVIYPVVFFVLGLIVFFFLILILTNSKLIALLSSGFLAILPAYLYRTMAGFADHDVLGMFAFFSATLVFSLGLKFLDKQKEQDKQSTNLIKTILFGVGVGFLTLFTMLSWSGVASFIFMIFPLSFLILWIVKTKNPESLNKKYLLNFLIFYLTWFFSGILFSLIFGFSFSSIISRFFLRTSSLIAGTVLLFSVIDYLLILKRKILKGREKYRIGFSFIATFFLGVLLLGMVKGDLISVIPDIVSKLLHPMGVGRTGLTVAENAQPYLDKWIGQIGEIFFWLFYMGTFLVGVEMAKGIKKRKEKILFSLAWLIMISGILFSRISASSLLNGTNAISKFVYFGSLILFFGYFAWIYFKDGIKIKPEIAIIASWAFFTLISARGAVRFFFIITPFTVFMVGFFVVKIFDYWKKSKDDFLKMALVIILIISILGIIISSIGIPFNNSSSGFFQVSTQQAKQTGPSAGFQWQNAMLWVRNNTPKGSVFVHWWDYGYWVQYLGERPTVTDGGHAIGYWDHLIGRYLLTTPYPKTALSFMKTHNVSYLLIDPADLGKYPAYSKIGSGPKGEDRFSQIPIMISNPSQTKQTENKTIKIYQGGAPVDEDIIYGKNKIFLPSGKAIVAGVILEYSKKNDTISFNQPKAVFIYNQKQTSIPIRYLYYDKKVIDFKGGFDAVIRIIPKINLNNQKVQIDNLGAVIYLSPKVSKSLFAQLYLLDNAFGEYKTITLAHAQSSPLISNLKSRGAKLGEFVYFRGFRGPIKIWKVNYPSDTLVRKEFLRTSGRYAEFDNLTFTK